ncbi:MAG TPA: YncE family protein [Gaiellaceae bacterium]|nr:YncE family protein [Gaiellaceae bacterium]
MRTFIAVSACVAALLVPSSVAATSGGRPVALVVAETSNEVFAVSLGPHGGHVLKRVRLDDPLMVATTLRGPAVVVDPHGRVTLLAWHSLRPIKVFRGFRVPEVAAIAPGGRYAYVSDGGSGRLVVLDLRRRRIVGRVFVGYGAHHLDFSPDGRRLWVALSETATTIVRLDTANLRRPRVVGRIHPRVTGHGIEFAPDGRTVWVSSSAAPFVTVFSAASGRPLREVAAGKGPQEIAFSGTRALITSGYGSSLESVSWRTYVRHRSVAMPYGSFNLATLGGDVVTSSVLNGDVTELRAGTLTRMWTTKLAPVTRYVAISLWPG